ncbi:MAG: type II toxin-antitoxin system HicA family toxin [Nitrospirae bacterium]|nr:type II toxin-antitoxin system HicA family toxin [Nitrospirota bacterium]
MGWSIKRETAGSHRVLSRPGWPNYVFAFHDGTEIGPRMLARIAKKDSFQTGRSVATLPCPLSFLKKDNDTKQIYQ